MTRRYFVDSPIAGTTAVLRGDEAKHLAKVLRASAGDQVILFAGDGWEHEAEITAVQKSQVTLEIRDSREVSREASRRVELAVALPKGDRQRYLIEKCVELGVSRVIPLVTTRSVAQASSNALQRCRRYVIEASKQCGRNHLMEIATPQSCGECWILEKPTVGLIAHPDAPSQDACEVVDGELQGPLRFAIGPEGGFTDDEVAQALSAGWQPLDLGPRILRVETAALAIAARYCGD